MMEEKKFEEIMEHMEIPNVNVHQHQHEFRARLLNTKKSAGIGIILLILPFLFISGVMLKHYLQIDFGIFTSVYQWIGDVDRQYGDNSLLNWVIRLLLVVGPLAAIVINLLAILHFRYEKAAKELIISLKVKVINLLIVLVCSLVFVIFFLYLIIENA